MSFSNSYSQSFTLTNAKYLASKIAADLKRIQRFYNAPSDTRISEFEQELIELLKNGYLKTVTYGFQRNENWIEPTLVYTAQDLSGLSSTDDDPGRISIGADVNGASFCSYLLRSEAWWNLSQEERNKFNQTVLIKRTSGDEPGIDGYLVNDRTYTSGGKSLNRSSIKKY